ncbi:PREDICTED: uncharacterized metal-dependent hydrolase YabD [Theobroma cacao]|uniref:Uncharacterized metal-dependent hydrolase YabD n=1 Tax=Theobroma cacao TaxID=3641 RepID=A0AB32WB93_THECC|nr:PREDICTED: uncharacterized metal-dependent hydrolase YabD [Theobroma cacao]
MKELSIKILSISLAVFSIISSETNLKSMAMKMKLFDAHCHLQDQRMIDKAPQLIATAYGAGVVYFAVNGITEKDWHLVKEMSDEYYSVIPNFGLHPWFVQGKSPSWFSTLKEFFEANPSAAVGEIGLDKSPLAPKGVDFADQIEVFKKQIKLAKELERPASVHCLDAFPELLRIMKDIGPFPSGVILHSFQGPPEVVPELTKLGSYFSFSGHLMPLQENKARKVVKAVPLDRILLETDSPDGLPKNPLFLVPGNDTLNQPANVHSVLIYIASLLEMSKEELAEISFKNAVRLFSFQGSKIPLE